MAEFVVNIDHLIDIVSRGGHVKTGIDVFNKWGVLLLGKDVPLYSVNSLMVIKKYGVGNLPIDFCSTGGVWDRYGNPISFPAQEAETRGAGGEKVLSENVDFIIKEISEKKTEATQKYKKAKTSIKKIIGEIKSTGGRFDIGAVEETITDVVNFLMQDNAAFSHMSKEILSYDDYLYNHSVNTCLIGAAVLLRFNDHFSESINNHLFSIPMDAGEGNDHSLSSSSFVYYYPQDLHDIALGYFLHDIGKTWMPENILNKQSNLSEAEFEIVKTHSYEKGFEILCKNHLENPFMVNSVRNHHALLFKGEKGCYPSNIHHLELPPYVKICKLADMYDAMTSKRAYKDAFNPVGVVTAIYRKYANKDRMLQFVLKAFVEIVGIYPPGSVLNLTNGQMVYVLDSKGPIVIPFTDKNGRTLSHQPEPLNMADLNIAEWIDDDENRLDIDRFQPLKSPIEVFDVLPEYLRVSIQ